MKKYDDVVVGAGSSGLALSQLLAMNGRKVLLIEKGPSIGGGFVRFRKNGVPFDTGFHFTGGFTEDGILNDMLNVLGIREYINPIFLHEGKENRYVFENGEKIYEVPSGVQRFIDTLKEYFPHEHSAIDTYFAMAEKVYRKTSSLNLLTIAQSPEVLEEDYVSLQSVLDGLTNDQYLKGILCTYCMCYGVKPSEVSFSNHCRVAYGLYEAVARVEHGGDAFIQAYTEKFANFDIDIKVNTHITECTDVNDHLVHRLVLNTGEEISFKNCIFTIHPKEIIDVLPKEALRKAFIERVDAFEPSIGFFTLHGVVNAPTSVDNFHVSITSIFPSPDINTLLGSHYTGDNAVVVMKSLEMIQDTPCKVMNILEPTFLHQVHKWHDTTIRKRGDSYAEYKKTRTRSILDRVMKIYPDYKDTYDVYDAASLLTYRDYLHSYDGTAYGIKQKIGQFNLFGKLPVRNMYAAGQSAVLPGIVGAMLSSFIIARTIIGKEKYEAFIHTRMSA